MTNSINKIKVYLDTSVISYLEQNDAPIQRDETREVWNSLKSGKYDIFISDVVINELLKCADEEKQKLLLNHLLEINYTVVNVDEETVALAEHIIDFGILKQKSFDDCQHIAAAILNNCDIIVSWNFRHIVNMKTIRGIKVITTMDGYKDILIYPPTALLEEEDDDD